MCIRRWHQLQGGEVDLWKLNTVQTDVKYNFTVQDFFGILKYFLLIVINGKESFKNSISANCYIVLKIYAFFYY